jgi:hypothetical protein
MSECLHCDIGELIAERTSHGPKPVDLAEIGSMIAQALGEFILAAPQHEQAKPDGRMPRDAFADVSGYPDESERPHRSHYRLLTFAFRGVFRRALPGFGHFQQAGFLRIVARAPRDAQAFGGILLVAVDVAGHSGHGFLVAKSGKVRTGIRFRALPHRNSFTVRRVLVPL